MGMTENAQFLLCCLSDVALTNSPDVCANEKEEKEKRREGEKRKEKREKRKEKREKRKEKREKRRKEKNRKEKKIKNGPNPHKKHT